MWLCNANTIHHLCAMKGEADRWEQARRANEGETKLEKLEYEVTEVVHPGNELDYHGNGSLKPIALDRHEINCVTTQYVRRSLTYSILVPCPDTRNRAEPTRTRHIHTGGAQLPPHWVRTPGDVSHPATHSPEPFPADYSDEVCERTQIEWLLPPRTGQIR